MKIKLLVSRSGFHGAQSVGEEIEVGNAEGIRMIEAGQATPVRETKVERAVPKKKPEKAKK